MAYQIGEVEQLKSGGPLMTILSVDEATRRIVCQWFDRAVAVQSDFPPEVLVGVPRPTGGIRVGRRSRTSG